MNCNDAQKFIHAYLDGEFDEREEVAIVSHVQGCPSCQRMARMEERFRNLVRATGSPQAPSSLRDRVLQSLDAEEERQEEQTPRRWAWRLIPAAAAVALVIGVTFSDQPQLSPLSRMVEQSVQWHRSQLPMDVMGSSPEQVQQFFQDKVPFAVRPPAFSAAQARLVGARLSNLREHQAVYLTYQVGNQRVSVFIFDSTAVPRHRAVHGVKMTRVGDRDVLWRGIRGYNVALYTQGGTGYAVTSDMSPDRLFRLISQSR